MTETAVGSGPFDTALRDAIAARGLSLERLRSKLSERGLQVGIATLSYWQRGLRRPERAESLRVVAALEDILNVPPQALTVLLGPPRPRGGAVKYPPDTGRYAAILPRPTRMAALLARLDMAAAARLHLACELDTIELGADRTVRRASVTQVVQAHQDHADRSVAIMWQDPGADVSAVAIRPTQNCRLGRVRRDTTAGLVAAELLFDTSLHAGDTRVLSYEVVDHDPIECDEVVRAFRFPADTYVMQVRFDADALPVRCHRFRARGVGAADTESAEVSIDNHHTVHILAPHSPVGIIGLRWEWT